VKKKLISAIKVIMCVVGVIYAALMVYGIWTQGLTATFPWLMLGCMVGAVAMAVETCRMNREVDRILANMEAMTGRINKIDR